MAKLFSSVCAAIFITIISIFVMINGWGLEPKSWSWIIWGSVGVFVISIIASIAANE